MQPDSASASSAPASAPETVIPPRLDLWSGAGWVVFGIAVLVASWRMDRLESQGATLWTMPGLVPGLYGIVIALLGALLVLRSVRRGALARADAAPPADGVRGRVALAAALMLGYALLALGRVPFELATAVFVFAFVALYDRDRGEGSRPWRSVLILAGGCAIGAALVISVVFERVFLVRLP